MVKLIISSPKFYLVASDAVIPTSDSEHQHFHSQCNDPGVLILNSGQININCDEEGTSVSSVLCSNDDSTDSCWVAPECSTWHKFHNGGGGGGFSTKKCPISHPEGTILIKFILFTTQGAEFWSNMSYL